MITARRTALLRNIATFTNKTRDIKLLEKDAELFSQKLEMLREELQAQNEGLTIIDILSDDYILSGALDPRFTEAMAKLGATTETIKDLKDLGFNAKLSSFYELSKFIDTAYSVLPRTAKKLSTSLTQEIESPSNVSTYFNAIKAGAFIAAMPMLTIARYVKVKNIEVGEGVTLADIQVAEMESYEEWIDQELTRVTFDLLMYPNIPAYVGICGIEEFMTVLVSVNTELADLVMSDLTDETTFKFSALKSEEFINLHKKLSKEDQAKVVSALHALSAVNIIGSINAGGAPGANTIPLEIPSAISIIDAYLGLFILTGNTIIETVTALGPDASPSEIVRSIDDEVVLTVIDVCAMEMAEYANGVEIALNLLTLVASFSPKYLFTNPTVRYQVREIGEANMNLSDILLPRTLESEEE